ncbi:MAG: helix-turn-helix domain-containing protein [Propionibacteriaceae bacterium]|nr:helix-turn-helix domain-containing protein [Propionibacteriaceae bacterium]
MGFGSIGSVPALGAAMRQARLDAGLTQAELAERAGVSRHWLVTVENAQVSGVDLGRVFRVLRVLDLWIRLEGVETLNPETALIRAWVKARP